MRGIPGFKRLRLKIWRRCALLLLLLWAACWVLVSAALFLLHRSVFSESCTDEKSHRILARLVRAPAGCGASPRGCPAGRGAGCRSVGAALGAPCPAPAAGGAASPAPPVSTGGRLPPYLPPSLPSCLPASLPPCLSITLPPSLSPSVPPCLPSRARSGASGGPATGGGMRVRWLSRTLRRGGKPSSGCLGFLLVFSRKAVRTKVVFQKCQAACVPSFMVWRGLVVCGLVVCKMWLKFKKGFVNIH